MEYQYRMSSMKKLRRLVTRSIYLKIFIILRQLMVILSISVERTLASSKHVRTVHRGTGRIIGSWNGKKKVRRTPMHLQQVALHLVMTMLLLRVRSRRRLLLSARLAAATPAVISQWQSTRRIQSVNIGIGRQSVVPVKRYSQQNDLWSSRRSD